MESQKDSPQNLKNTSLDSSDEMCTFTEDINSNPFEAPPPLIERGEMTPETARGDRVKNHIVMNSIPKRIQFTQGGSNDEEESAPFESQHKSNTSQTFGKEILTSSIDETSQIGAYRDSSVSMRKSLNPLIKPQPVVPAFTFVEQAIPMITHNSDTEQFEVNPDVIAMMSQVRGPIGVVAVAGMYRTGKSYFLNRVLLNRKKGFGVGPSINPCTKGIWIWGTPLSGFTPEGEPITVIVVDSEGIGGLDEDNNHDMRIFSLALLLSSYFLYNSMGQIDENALNSLSLVVNLTKHIQTSLSGHQASSTHQEFPQSPDSNAHSSPTKSESDLKLQAYLPSFLWIVRDFALQLEEEDGTEITASQYLEKVLFQKGGNGSDSKNVIRSCLLKYFTKRDACTLIRPLVDEEQLQNLESMEIESLRSEFVEQAMALRRKVLHNIPIKNINGHAMDGTTWVSLVQMYVDQINTGSVPCIESSWNYICRQKAQNQLSDAAEQFEKEVEQITMPSNESDFASLIADAERTAMIEFKKDLQAEKAILDEYEFQLRSCMKERIEELKHQNTLACQDYAQQMLMQLFEEVEQVKHGLLQDPANTNFAQVEFALRELGQYYDSNCFEFSEKALFLAEAKSQFLLDLMNQLSHLSLNQQRMQVELEQQIKERLGVQIRETKEEARNEQLKLEGQWKEALLAKSEIEATNQIMKDQLDHFKEAKQKDDVESTIQISTLREQLAQVQDENRSMKENYEEQVKDIQRGIKQNASEFEKEKALLAQKVEFLEKALKEKSDRERDSTSQLRSQRDELAAEIKTVCSKYETELKTLNQDLDEEKEKAIDLETKLSEKISRLSELEIKSRDVEETLKKQLGDTQTSLKSLQTTASALKQENEQQLAVKLKHTESNLESQSKLLEALEKKVKTSVEAELQTNHDSKKSIAMRDQKIEFLSMQLKEAKDQLTEAQRQHSQMVAALNKHAESSDEEKENSAASRLELLQKEFATQSEENMAQIKDLAAQNEALSEKLNDTEQQHKLNSSEVQRLLDEAKQVAEDAENQKLILQEKIKQLEVSRVRQQEETEQRIADMQLALEKEVREKEESNQLELVEASQRSEEQLSQLKKFYEIEKEKSELRISEEKERANRRLATFQEELEVRLREETRDKDQEIEMLQAQCRELEQHQQNYATQMEHEVNMKSQMADNLERLNGDLKERISQLEHTRNTTFEKQMENFEQQRQELNSRIDRQMKENLEKDKLIATLQHRVERTTDALDRKSNTLEQSIVQLEKQKAQLQDKLETTKMKLTELQDDTMRKEHEMTREQALLSQQIEFLNRKIDELQRANDESQKMFDEKIKVCRQEIFDDAQAQVDRVTSEKELWETKYEQKRRALKELENMLGKKKTELEKSVNLLQSQVQKLEGEKYHLEEASNDRIAKLESQIANLDSSAGQALYYGSAQGEEIMKLKNNLQDYEHELQDLQSNYDRDKALWEGKVMFLETQKENYKKDLLESQKKFEITLEQLQKRGSHDKEKSENNQQVILKVIEGKYKSQIKEMIDTHQALSTDSQSKARRLDAELTSVTQKLQALSRGKNEEVSMLEKRLQESQEKEQKYSAELEEVKKERNRRVSEYTKQIEKDKETFKLKLADMDRKGKDAETRRAQLLFQIEKERANWVMEEDHFRRKTAESEDYIKSLERSKDAFRKENEKLRVELKALNGTTGNGRKQFMFSTNQNTANTSTTPNRFLLQKSGNPNRTSTLSLGLGQKQASSGQATQGSVLVNGSGSIINAAMSRLKENQHSLPPTSSQPSLKSSNSSGNLNPIKLLASPDINATNRQHKLPPSLPLSKLQRNPNPQLNLKLSANQRDSSQTATSSSSTQQQNKQARLSLGYRSSGGSSGVSGAYGLQTQSNRAAHDRYSQNAGSQEYGNEQQQQ